MSSPSPTSLSVSPMHTESTILRVADQMLKHAQCTPAWYHNGVQCPYGTTPTLDWGLDPLQLSSWTWPYQHDPLPLYLIAALYSSLEIVVGYGLIFFIFGRSTASLTFFAAYWGYKVPMVRLLKHMVESPRPLGTCLVSCGMPSGHSMFALMFFTLGALLLLTRAKPPSRMHVTGYIGLLALVLLPMPWSRVQLGDHSIWQVIWGSVAGMVLGAMFFVIIHRPSIQYMMKYLGTSHFLVKIGFHDNLSTFWGGSTFQQSQGKETQALMSSRGSEISNK